jgi:hypothetical protein
MRKILLLVFIASALGFSGCKKCWTCSPIPVNGVVNGGSGTFAVCGKDEKNRAENAEYSTAGGSIYFVECR